MGINMFNLYAKTITLSLVISLLILGGFYFAYFHFINLNRSTINRLFVNGNFVVIQQLLKNTPPASWGEVIDSIQPADRPKAKILNMDELKISKEQKEDLKKGKIVILTGPVHYFLNYFLPDIFALQKIGNTKFVLQIQDKATMYTTIQDNTIWMVHLIATKLETSKKNNWPKIIKYFQSIYNIPLQIVSMDSKQLPLIIRKNQYIKGLQYEPPKSDGFITKVYFKFEHLDKILILGPINYPKYLINVPKMQFYYLISFTILTILIVFLSTWIFSRNVRKLLGLTNDYGKGLFDKKVKFSRFSILYGVHNNIVSMGSKIKGLMKTQQNMSRFVAHEIRTPLYTMQLALDAMEKSFKNKKDPTKHMNSLREDIKDLNKLVSYFLIYSQSTSNEMKIKKQSLDIKKWLFELVSTHQGYDLKVNLEVFDDEKSIVKFDPDLLKLAVNNLISNALKFANNEIQLSLNLNNDQMVLHVDDDGSGIEDENKQLIFQSFVTLATGESFGKHIGLGLAITKSIVELHGGHITLEDSPILSGSRFSIYLPIV
ncbi:sensor histidine kinase [Legionella longbeachae]|nr:sensor histidine kinase [Legionella longbeachae]RZV26654.1 HAMP domain-containing histidine kinase [Legionella longbeachae]